MRTITTAQAVVRSLTARAEYVKVEIQDGGGTWRDLASFPGFNALESVEWSESVDDPGPRATVSFLRDLDKWSVAPLMAGAYANQSSALLDLNRGLRISVAVVPADTVAAAGDYFQVFQGYVDSIEWADEIGTLTCRGLYSKLQDTYLEDEPVLSYGSVGSPVAMRVWTPSTAYSVGDYVIPTDANRNGKFYKCTTGGTSGTTEPTWPASSTVSDNSVVWTYQATTTTAGYAVEYVMGSAIAFAGLSTTLSTPSSPSWTIKQYKADRGPLLDCLRSLAFQIGWDVRYKWGGSSFDLTFFQPDRSKVANDASFYSYDYETVDTLKLDKAGIRNVVRVIYPDASSTDPTGRPVRKTYTATDSTSISRYGRLFMEISEADSSQIDSTTEATSMANACLADLKDPKVEQVIRLAHGFPWVEIGDLYLFYANGRHYDSDQSLAVFSYSHRATDGRIETTLSCRGKPAGAYSGWHAMSAVANPQETSELRLFHLVTALTLTASACVGGVRLDVTGTPNRDAGPVEYEYHVSASNGFTPDSSSAREITAARSAEIANLIPGATYYARVVPFIRTDAGIQRGQPSAQVTCTAGQASALHVVSDVEWGRLPLNGGFETQTDASAPPDHWSMASGTWGINCGLYNDSSGYSGANYLRFFGAGAAEIKTDLLPVVGGTSYVFSVAAKKFTGSPYVTAYAYFYDYAGSLITSVVLLNDALSASWAVYRGYVGASSNPSNARFVRISLTCDGSSDTWGADDLRLTRADLGVSFWDTASLLASWVNVGGGAPWGFRLEPGGIVRLRGLISSGTTTTGTQLSTLPADLRPAYTRRFAVATSAGAGWIEIATDGKVYAGSVSATWTSFDGVTFETF